MFFCPQRGFRHGGKSLKIRLLAGGLHFRLKNAGQAGGRFIKHANQPAGRGEEQTEQFGLRILRSHHAAMQHAGQCHVVDEAAMAAANRMRFKPAMRTGQPVDSTAIVHVVFQLAY